MDATIQNCQRKFYYVIKLTLNHETTSAETTIIKTIIRHLIRAHITW